MKYHVIHIKTNFAQEWQKDIFDQQLGELGIDTIDGEDYYIPSDLLESQITHIQQQISDTEGALFLSIDACPDENWNAVWEAEHPQIELPLGIRIVPHCAFGAGHHETTSMMIQALMASDLQGKRVLDHGTGTGVLAIFAKRLGAAQVTAVDIDEKSVENAQENAALNKEDIDVLHTSSFQFSPFTFHLILANIHRNILLEYMPQYADALQTGGELWLSGFFESDCNALISAARQYGMTLIATHANNDWCLLQLRKA